MPQPIHCSASALNVSVIFCLTTSTLQQQQQILQITVLISNQREREKETWVHLQMLIVEDIQIDFWHFIWIFLAPLQFNQESVLILFGAKLKLQSNH